MTPVIDYEPVIHPIKQYPEGRIIGYSRKANCRNITHNLKGECYPSLSVFYSKIHYRDVNFTFPDFDRVEISIGDAEILGNIV